MPGYLCTATRIISLSPLSLATDMTDAILGASGLWLGTRTGADGTVTLVKAFFFYSPWLHGQQIHMPCLQYEYRSFYTILYCSIYAWVRSQIPPQCNILWRHMYCWQLFFLRMGTLNPTAPLMIFSKGSLMWDGSFLHLSSRHIRPSYITPQYNTFKHTLILDIFSHLPLHIPQKCCKNISYN